MVPKRGVSNVVLTTVLHKTHTHTHTHTIHTQAFQVNFYTEQAFPPTRLFLPLYNHSLMYHTCRHILYRICTCYNCLPKDETSGSKYVHVEF
jgi:hypothetical protein